MGKIWWGDANLIFEFSRFLFWKKWLPTCVGKTLSNWKKSWTGYEDDFTLSDPHPEKLFWHSF
jgi:hypothetical protein